MKILSYQQLQSLCPCLAQSRKAKNTAVKVTKKTQIEVMETGITITTQRSTANKTTKSSSICITPNAPSHDTPVCSQSPTICSFSLLVIRG